MTTQPRNAPTAGEVPPEYPYPTQPPPTTRVPIPATPVSLPVPGVPMPSATTLALLAYAYRRRQIAIASRASRQITALYNQHIDPARFMDSWRDLLPAIQSIVDQHYDMAAADAADYYQKSRVMVDFGLFKVPLLRLDTQYRDRVLQSQTAGVFFHQAKTVDSEVAAQISGRALRAAAARVALKGGRETVLGAVAADGKAAGWERMIDANSCSFCSMLASRGGVYRKDTVDFRAHDHCNCTAHAVFRGEKPVGAELAKQWQEVTKGKSGVAARAAWEEYWSAKNGGSDTGTTEQAAPENG